MQKLVQGIHQFQSSIFSTQRELFERLANGQHPMALFITCSDSRVNPNLITQTDPGDLFILRNAGNIIPPHGVMQGGEAATIEFATVGLHIKDIIVCGHSRCGAMHRLLDPSPVNDMPAMNTWLQYAESTRRIMKEKYPHLHGEPLLTATVEENVLVQLENLRTLPCVAAKLAAGELKLHGWVYKFETGRVFAYDPSRGQFMPFTEHLTELPIPAARLAAASI